MKNINIYLNEIEMDGNDGHNSQRGNSDLVVSITAAAAAAHSTGQRCHHLHRISIPLQYLIFFVSIIFFKKNILKN